MQPLPILHAQTRACLLDLMALLTNAVALTGPITLLCASLLLRNLFLRCALALRIAFLLALPFGSCLIFGAPALLLLSRSPPFLIALRLCPPIWFAPLLRLCSPAGLGAVARLIGAIAVLGLIPARSAQLATGRGGAAAWRMHAATGPVHRAAPSAGPAWTTTLVLLS
jgi:hypothetical protein